MWHYCLLYGIYSTHDEGGFLVLQRKNWEMGGVAENKEIFCNTGTHRRYRNPRRLSRTVLKKTLTIVPACHKEENETFPDNEKQDMEGQI
jgi:hypothetical protein